MTLFTTLIAPGEPKTEQVIEGTRVRWQGFDMDQWTFSIAAPIRSKTARPDRIHEGHSKRYRERLRDDLKSDGRQAATGDRIPSCSSDVD